MATKVIKEDKTPLKEFAGYRITRRSTTVYFGCGASQVNKKDLLNTAELFENPLFKKNLKNLMNYLNGDYSNFTFAISNPASVTKIRFLVEFLTPTVLKQVASLRSLKNDSSGRYTLSLILKIQPSILRRIAGTQTK